MGKKKFSLTVFLALVLLFGLVFGANAQRMGAWLDEVIAIEEPSSEAAITRLEVGEISIYAYTISSPEIYERVRRSPDLEYVESFGSYNELTFNPAGPVFPGTGKLNPFAVAAIREAMNWLIDRNYVVDEIMGGMAVPKYFPITAAFPDYARLADVCRALELKYAPDPERAEEIITEEMIKLGAEKVGGVWHYEGEPVEIILLIRTEDERLEIGDYVGTLLEDIGFVIDHQYKTAAEASPIWWAGDPGAGQYHIYTGGWITTVVARDQATNPNFFYTPRGIGTPLWQAYTPEPEFDELTDRLARRDFNTMEERADLFARVLELAMKDSVRLWLVDQLSISPHRADVSVAGDLAGAISGSYLWPHTARFLGREGGTMYIAMPSILTEPWNPTDGSNWIYDMMLIRATGDLGYMWDPYTGLHYPHRVERAELFIKEGLPVSTTLDWVDLHFVEENVVPDDAWISWDSVDQRFITVGEMYPDGLTANRRVLTYFPEDFFDKVKWHDGSSISLGDMILSFILGFDRAMEDSEFFDEAQVPTFESFERHFRGMKIVQEDPLIIEYFSDLYYLDGEWYIPSYFPYYAQGPGAWHNIALGYLAEINEEVAFSSAKADKLEVEWLNMVSGPTIATLEKFLQQAKEENFIPYEPTLGQYISAEEAQARWQNLQNWYDDKGHFWIGTGPFYLERAYPVEGTAHLKRFEDYPDPAGKWDIFADPMVAEVDMSGPRLVSIGGEATYEVHISYADEPYPTEFLQEVKYLLFNARGEIVHVGEAVPYTEGLWHINLTEELTKKLVTGASRIETIVVPIVVSIPSFESLEFVSYQ